MGIVTSMEKKTLELDFLCVNKKQTTKKNPEKQVAVRQVGALFMAQALSEGNMKHKGLSAYLEEAVARVIQGLFL